MATTPCRQCAADVSAGATTCPHCGCPDPVAQAAAPEEKWQFHMLPAEVLGERRVKLPSAGGKAPYWVAGMVWAIAFLVHSVLDGPFGFGVVFGTLAVALLILWAVAAMPFSRWRGVIFLALSLLSIWQAPWHADPRQARRKAMMREGKMPADYEGSDRSPVTEQGDSP